VPSCSGAAAHSAARRSAANASSATFTANVGSWIQTSLINVVHSTVLLRHIVMSVDDSFVLLTADHQIASTLRSMRLLLVGEMEENRKITKQKNRTENITIVKNREFFSANFERFFEPTGTTTFEMTRDRD